MKNIEYIKKYYKGNINDALKQLEQNIPVQYIVGNVDFYGYNFIVNENVLIPRFETEQLVEKTINLIKKNFDKKIDIVDIGTGSGCIAITLKKQIDCNMDAVDISLDALNVAKENANKNNADINFIQGNMLDKLNKKYDVIISNPPYIAYDEEIENIVKNNEPNIALYADDEGMYYYKKILENAREYLKDNFIIAFEIGYLQGPKLKEYANNFFSDSKIFIEKDLSLKDRFLFIVKTH
ncbi:MAG: peptide chain release factor N(5)-glutamine methyltransferase [Bacilli bacterium]|nr:peptide chain release factor N(5)-glutamine methyltransferase [Bacilli bacterium]